MTALIIAMVVVLFIYAVQKMRPPRTMATRIRPKPRLSTSRALVSVTKPVQELQAVEPVTPCDVIGSARRRRRRRRGDEGVLTARQLGLHFPQESPDWKQYDSPAYLRRGVQDENFGLVPDAKF